MGIVLISGTVTYVDLFSGLFQLSGMSYTHSGDTTCGTECEVFINITTTYWNVCFENTKDTQKVYLAYNQIYGGSIKTLTPFIYGNLSQTNQSVLYKKARYGRKLWVNLDKVDFILTTEPKVKSDWLVPARGKGNWRFIKDGDCWNRLKNNKIKLIVHKEKEQTVKWGFNISGYVDIDPILQGIPNRRTENTKYRFKLGNERTDVSAFIRVDEVKTDIDILSFLNQSRRFGFVFNETNINNMVNSSGKTWDKKIFYQLDSTENYIRNAHNPYVLERNLPGTTGKTNEIGQVEQRQNKRFITFEGIFNKQDNLYEFVQRNITDCIEFDENLTCLRNGTINYTIRTKRDISYSFTRQGRRWIIEFFNIFDLDPSFIDDTDTDWDAGTVNNMQTEGTGSDANISSTGTFGHFASQIFDSNNVDANWTNITLRTEVPYETEIGHAEFDNTSAPFADLSDLNAIWEFNNGTGSNDSLVEDLSVSLKTDDTYYNVTCSGTSCPTYNFGDKAFGRGAMDFETDNSEFLEIQQGIVTALPYSICAWFKAESVHVGILVWTGQSAAANRYNTIVVRTDLAGDPLRVVSIRGATNGQVDSTKPIEVGQWHFGCGVWASTSSRTVYLDGANSATETTDVIDSAEDRVSIGRAGDSTPTGYFDGLIDEVSVYDRELTAEEVLNLYKRGAYRLNLSVRTCNDNACDGETYTVIGNITNGTKRSLIPFDLSKNRYFQYNITFSNFSAYDTQLNVNNVSIELTNITAEVAGDTTVPIINGTLNESAIISGTVLNATFNMTDEVDNNNFNCTIVINSTGANRFFNFSFTSYTALTNQKCSQNFTISEVTGTVINITGIAIDNSSNRAQNETIFTVASEDTCSPDSPLTADHNYLPTDNCIITSDLDANGNTITCSGGTGTLTISALISNIKNIFIHGDCDLFCRNTPTCFG